MRTLGQLAVRVRPLYLDDSLGKAADAVRSSPFGAVPVIADGRVAGIVTAGLVADTLAAGDAEELKHASVRRLPLRGFVALPEALSPQEALLCFHANDLDWAPVVDPFGNLLGMVSSGELATAVCGRLRPPMIGGMATPFGVYLTGGGVRGGVGDLALMTTGVFMAAMILFAACLTDWALSPEGLARLLPGVFGWLPRLQPSGVALAMIPFALLFRLSWVTGYHAAEHQVVHAIEAGDDLTPDTVRAKPRVHPRCGTNLVAAVSIMGFFWSMHRAEPVPPLGALVQQIEAMNPPLAMLVTFLLWRRVGGWLQQHVTTRPATLWQLESGITAARQLLERYQEGPRPLGKLQRIWNMGLIQVFGGWILVLVVVSVWAWLLPGLTPPALRGPLW